MSTQILPADAHLAEIRELFAEYTNMLVEGDPSFREYLKVQHYDEELDHPLDKYGPPGGRLHLALYNGVPVGCAALRRIDEENCEMKRLYVRPSFRKRGIGSLLLNQILVDARSIGYRYLLLDTLPFLEEAI